MHLKHYYLVLLAVAVIGFSCEKDGLRVAGEVPQEVIHKIEQMGFNPDGIVAVEDGYLIERDIIITHENLENMPTIHRVPGAEQYSTNNLVTTGGSRTITVYMEVDTGGGSGGGGNGNGNGKGGGPKTSKAAAFPSTYSQALDEAISRYNAQNLEITFQRVTTTNADITFSRLRKGDERQGILGSAGFPTASGDPYNQINMSGILESTYGLSVNGIATIMAHEMGHCIGFRHTDYFDRSISCGGSPYNEGDGGVGANHIPGTPTGATLSAQSWMLSCTDGSNRNFNNDDRTALSYLY